MLYQFHHGLEILNRLFLVVADIKLSIGIRYLKDMPTAIVELANCATRPLAGSLQNAVQAIIVGKIVDNRFANRIGEEKVSSWAFHTVQSYY